MAASRSNAFSNCGEGMSSGKGSQAISIGSKRAFVETSGDAIESMAKIAKAARQVQATLIRGERASVKESADDSESLAINRTKPLLKEMLSVESKPLKVSVHLSDDLVLKIIGALDFKSLFRAQVLSKTFQDNFQRDVFRREVNSSSWKSYAPLFVNDNYEAVGYDSSSQEWERLPSHSFAESASKGYKLRASAGALLIWTSPHDLANESDPFQVEVSNSLTKRWKQLRPRPKMCWPESVHAMSIPENNSYKVIIGTLDVGDRGRESIRLQIFDSFTDSWTEECCEQVTGNQSAHWGGEVLKDGILYMLIYTLGRRPGESKVTYQLVTYDVIAKKWARPELYKVFNKGGIWNHKRLKFSNCHSSELLVCGSNLMHVVADVSGDGQVVSVYRLGTETGFARKVATARDDILDELQANISDFCFSAGKDGCIYIGGEHPNYSLISVNVETQQWTRVYSSADGDVDLARPRSTDIDLTFSASLMDKFPASFSSPLCKWRWSSVAYQPGLNPFIKL